MISESHLVLEGLRSDRETIAIVDIGSGDVIDFDLGDDIARGDGRDLRVRPVRNADAFVVGNDGQPGTAYLMTPEGDVVDIGLEAGWDEPFIQAAAAHAAPDGTVVAFVNFASSDLETALVSLPDLDVTVLDEALATLSNERVRTTTRRDVDGFEVETFDLSGNRTESFEVDPFRIGIDTDDGELITPSLGGEILRWSSDGESERLGNFDSGDDDHFVPVVRTDGPDPTLAVGAFDGELLLVGTDGSVVDGIELDAPVNRFDSGRRCVPVITETSVAIIEAATGHVLTEEFVGDERGPIIAASDDDGCTLFLFGDEQLLIGADEIVEFRSGETLAGLSGDGSVYAARNGDAFEVRRLGDDAGSDVELDVDPSSSIYFLQR